MSSDILGDEFDIHGGGIDLIFPHHENEIAQSEGAGKKFARYWIHHGLLTINGQKMSKSLGNFITVDDFIAKYHDPGLLKLIFLFTHYAHPVDYTDEKVQEARQALERVRILFDKAVGLSAQLSSDKLPIEVEDAKRGFIKAMDDDFNTPQAVASIFELVNLANKNITDEKFVISAVNVLKELCALLGILSDRPQHSDVNQDTKINQAINARLKARLDHDYALADKIRKDLEAQGVILEDGKSGTTWRRKL
jgi:cysteinyl-tRNA synthetase